MRTLLLALLVGCGSAEAPKNDHAAKPAHAEPAPKKAELKKAEPKKTAPTQAAGAPAGDLKPGNVDSGKVVFEANCVACHQADGTGMGGMLAADFTKDKTRLAKTDAELTKSIREGITGKIGTMPPWGAVISEQETADVIAYLRATFGDKK